MFESFYRRAGGEIDYTGASFGEYNDADSRHTYDRAMTRDGKLNGPRRYIYNSVSINTLTYKDGEYHGLYIRVYSDVIYVWVLREGSEIF